MQVLFAILLAALGIAQAQMSFPDITQAAAAIERVFGTIDRVPGIGMNDEGALAGLRTSMHACMLLLPHCMQRNKSSLVPACMHLPTGC